MKPTDKTALVTHRNCLDGTGCAAAFIWAGGLKKNIFFRDPRKCALTPEQAAPFDEVWFADVCPPDLSDPAGGKPWKVWDHHETNILRHGEDREGCTFRRDQCGTSLLANALGLMKIPGDILFQVKNVITAIEHHDLGRFDASPDVMLVANLAVSYSQDKMLDTLVLLGDDVFEEEWCAERASAIGDYHKILAEKYAQAAYGAQIEHPIDGKVWVAVTTGPHMCVNTIADTVLDGRLIGGKAPQIAVVAAYDAASVSLRTRAEGAPNVARMAEMYNGGGHPRAAGFGLDRTAMKRLFEVIFS